jgi:pyruvate/2-oxoacid:ferredoxin oxidoreductase beta subunit
MWKIPSTASSRNQLSLRLSPQRLWGACYTVADPTLVERVLREAFNHLGPSVVQAVVDLTCTIHDGSSRNLAVANEPYPMTTRSNPC